MSEAVDAFLSKTKTWGKELAQLRKIILECDLTEEIKWGQPCYSYEGKNIAIIGELKDKAVIGFFKGVLLKDPKKLLVAQGKSTQSARSIFFTSVAEINKVKTVLKQYIYEAIALEESGKKVEFKKDLEPPPDELLAAFKKDPKLKAAFYELTPGRQRAYVIHFSQPKQPATREARIEKYKTQILNGIGLNDKYGAKPQ
jgi:uncharacterized protein YdeI (YjbR/CyaY-like superfamily)